MTQKGEGRIMKRKNLAFLSVTVSMVLLAGCATAKPRPASQSDLNGQVSALQNEVQAKDQQIQDLQYQLESQQQSLQTNFSRKGKNERPSIIRVEGVSAADLQKALVRAGYNPGPVDGHVGKRTKNAVKAFQRKNNLRADGIVGEKTWAHLKSAS